MIVTAIAVKIMDEIDRKKMLTYGAIGMGASLFFEREMVMLVHGYVSLL